MADTPAAENLDRPVTCRDFNALVQLFKEDRVKAEAEKVIAAAEREEFREFMKTTKEFMKKANEDRDMVEKFTADNMVVLSSVAAVSSVRVVCAADAAQFVVLPVDAA